MATNRSRKSSGGGKGKKWTKDVAWFVLVGACLVLFWNIPSNPKITDIPGLIIDKGASLAQWAPRCVGGLPELDGCSFNVPSGYGEGVDPVAVNPVTPSEASASLAGLTVAPAQSVPYNRDEWKHWVSVGPSCWDTREQVLFNQSLSIVLLDKDKKETADVGAACSIASGEWVDPYTGQTFTNPSDLDIDHMIPLSYAAQHGGQAWDAARKQQFANDLSNPNHLLAVSASANRQKSDKGPENWVPSNKDHHCDYAKNWIGVSQNYGLSLTQGDVDALTGMLATCK